MSRLMSVAYTADAVIARRKTVTRRLGWRFLKPGDRLTLCRKVMGRKKGEPLDRICEVEVVSVRREPLCAMTDRDVIREGIAPFDVRFDEWDWRGIPPAVSFVSWYAWTFGVDPYDEVTRIEWRYLDGEGCRCGHDWLHHNHSRKGVPCRELIPTREVPPGEFPPVIMCRCTGWDVSRLPAEGERLEFGRHRLNTPDAEAAPAWPSLGTVESRNVARFRREQNKARA